MSLTITHNTTADASFSTAGATAWNATHTLSGVADVSQGGTGSGSFTAGQILFGNGTSALAPTSNLFFDSTNNILRVNGTPTNAANTDKLQVNGNANINGIRYTNSTISQTNSTGVLNLTAGTGGFNMLGGDSSGATTGGGFGMTAGSATSGTGTGGGFSMTSGSAAGTGNGGDFVFYAGASFGSTGFGGSFYINAGSKFGGIGGGGSFSMSAGEGIGLNSVGGSFSMAAGSATGTNTSGGIFTMVAGAGESEGGYVQLVAGEGTGLSGMGGSFALIGGDGVAGGGPIGAVAGNSSGSGTGGYVEFNGGASASGLGGSVTFSPGVGGSTNGSILFRDAAFNILAKVKDGYFYFGTYAAKTTETFQGYVTIKDLVGNLRKVMICA